MERTIIVCVIFVKNEIHKNIAQTSLDSFPNHYKKIAVINNNEGGLDVSQFDYVIQNDINCLSRAWNKGIQKAIELNYHYFILPNLDLVVDDLALTKIKEGLERYPKAGIVSAQYITDYNYFLVRDESESYVDISHGDGSFSLFVLSKKAFEQIGAFDENFAPAYFEDCDYLERAWKSGFVPKKRFDAQFFHLIQSSVKNDKESMDKYPVFMQNNLEYFKKKWGKVPNHLPKDIRFN